MTTILLASLIVSTNLCSVCSGSGKVLVPCPRCEGRGYHVRVRQGSHQAYGAYIYRVPCTQCVKGLAGPRQNGTGKILIRCPRCRGKGNEVERNVK